jgi:HlyD family secretion protein
VVSAPDVGRRQMGQYPMAFPTSGERVVRGKRSWLIATVLPVAAAAIVATAWWSFDAAGAVRYATAPVTRGPMTRAVTATGTVNPQLTVLVGTYVSGVIQELYCDYNTDVKKGQLCAKIDPRPYQTELDQRKANLAVAKAQLEKDKASLTYAKVTFDRAAQLVQSYAVSRDTYDNARSHYEQAQAQLVFDQATIQQRQAALDAAQVNLDYTNIVSPVDGTVVSRNVTTGQTVAASFQTPTLFVIATDLTKVQVDTDVVQRDIGEIRTGQKATFTVDAFPGRIFQGTVGQIRQSPQTIQNVVTYDVIVAVDNADRALKLGMTAAVRLIIDHRDDVLRVPDAALRYRPAGAAGPTAPGQAQIWILRDGQPSAVQVVTGLGDGTFTEIVSGDVKAGDQVITAE